MRAKNWQSNRQTDCIKQQSLGGINVNDIIFYKTNKSESNNDNKI